MKCAKHGEKNDELALLKGEAADAIVIVFGLVLHRFDMNKSDFVGSLCA
jgi:hypothetical protein